MDEPGKETLCKLQVQRWTSQISWHAPLERYRDTCRRLGGWRGGMWGYTHSPQIVLMIEVEELVENPCLKGGGTSTRTLLLVFFQGCL